MDQPSIGILANRTSNCHTEMSYFQKLIKEGQRVGGNVFLFAPYDILLGRKKVRGFLPTQSGKWQEQIVPWPDMVIDRNRSRADHSFITLRNRKLFPYANSTYTYKWKATVLFAKTEGLKRWIPKTVLYSHKELRDMLKEFPILYIKPADGSGGFSIVKLIQKKGIYTVFGRERQATLQQGSFLTMEALTRWLDMWVRTQKIRSGGFMIQQGLDLELIPNRIADARLLIQKDGAGEWQVTGIALRIGGKNSPTTNILHKGGEAVPFEPYMIERFGAEKAAEIHKECILLSLEVVRTIEKRFGPMLEFGMDIGVDVNGQIWLIEANPKPSRNVFIKTGEVEIYNKAVERTIEYVMYLVRKQTGQIKETDVIHKETVDENEQMIPSITVDEPRG